MLLFRCSGREQDNIKSHLNFSNKYKLPFELLSAIERKVHKLYDVWEEKNMYGRKYMGIEKTNFLINKKEIL